MIYTITLNPAIDCAFSVPELIPGRVNRADSQQIRFGGKGINVSVVLREFGGASVLTGFIAGFTGDALAAGLTAEGFDCDFVKLERGMTRVNMKLISDSADGDPDTELNAPGPCPAESDLAALTEKLQKLVPGDTAVLAGSLPAGVNPDFVRTVAKSLPDGVRFVCDMTGESLRQALAASPELVKPNVHELFDLLGIRSSGDDHRDLPLIADGAAQLIRMGAANVLVTMGSAGAYYASAGGDSGFVPAPAAPAVCTGSGSAVGCGDSAVAGWLCGMGYADEDARSRGICAAGISGSISDAEAAARVAVAFGSASYFFGFPASHKNVQSMNTK